MNASAQRLVVRWIHLILSIPILGYIYGPVADIPVASNLVRFVFVPTVIISGLCMWKGHALLRPLRGFGRSSAQSAS
jgi:thiosulfate reductase cytochrome b subunit